MQIFGKKILEKGQEAAVFENVYEIKDCRNVGLNLEKVLIHYDAEIFSGKNYQPAGQFREVK